MRNVRKGGSYCVRALWAALVVGLACTAASADVSLLGVQYQEDNPYTEYLCYWHDRNYPTSCSTDHPGANLHVYLKNDGGSAVTLDDVDLETYSLDYALKQKWQGDHDCNSIWFRWDNPPDAILNAGEPAWYRMDPVSIPAGGVGQVIVRCRRVPTTTPLDVDVDTSANVIYADVTVDNTAPMLANISFSQDLKTVYMYWRRPNGTAPTTIKMDGTDVTSSCETVSDVNLDMACTVYTRSTALTEMDYHVFQGIYSDSKEALGGIRVWKNPFIYGSWAAFNIADNDSTTAAAWVDTCNDRGINTVEMNMSSGGLADYMATGAGRTDCTNKNYGFIKDDTGWGTWGDNPRLWFVDDEPDIEENAVLSNFCGTGYKIPCGSNPAGTMGMHFIDVAEDLRAEKDRPTSINLDGTFKPYSWAAYGQLVDVLCVDSYYEKRCMASHYFYTNTEPLYQQAKLQYATSLAGSWYAEPGPFRLLSYSCEANPSGFDPWPWADPQSKQTEIYYALAGGCKGINYWWFKDGNPSDGLGGNNTNLTPEDANLWKEIGLLGAEIKLLQPYLVTSHPIDLDLTGSTDVWVEGLVHSTDTLILIAVNDNHYIDENWHGTDTASAHIYLTLPDWMTVPVPTVFEVGREGLKNVSTTMTGDDLDMSIGTLSVGRLFIVTNDPELRMTLQDRYDYDVQPGIEDFDSTTANAITDEPTIEIHPSAQYVEDGATATFLVTASGGSQMTFQWQKDSSDLSNGGDISGATTFKLYVADADAGHEGDYRCKVTNDYGNATSNTAALAISTVTFSSHPTTTSVCTSGTATFSVSASGTGSLSYLWQKDASDLSNGGHYSGVTTSTLTISSAAAADEADYRCEVTDDNGPAYSNAAALTLKAGATITSHPENVLIEASETATFSVTATGEGDLSYQWQADSSDLSNGGDFSGVTTATLTIEDVEAADEADYRCVVTDDCSSANSNTASLTIDVCGDDLSNGDMDATYTNGVCADWTSYVIGGLACTFNSGGGNPYPGQRLDSTKVRATRYFGVRQTFDATVGDAFTFGGDIYCLTSSNTAICTLRADWDGGTAVSGASIVVTADQPAKSWTAMGYGSGNATGTSVTLFLDTRGSSSSNIDGDSYYDNIVSYRAHVPPPPSVSAAGSTSLDVNVNPGCNTTNSDAQYAITIGGGDYTLGTHWVQSGGTVSTSAVWQTDSTWGTKEVTGLTTGVTYTFKVKARYSSTYTEDTSLSSGASEATESSLLITDQPDNQLLCEAATASFSVTATGEGTVTYQWRKDESDLSNGGDISGATTSTLTISNVESADEADYECEVSDNNETLYSDTAALTLKDGTTITDHPDSDTIESGMTATFTVAATSGGGDITYQWQKDSSDMSNGGDISGVTTTTLTIQDVDSSDEADYRCVATGECDSATSNAATLTIESCTTDLTVANASFEGGDTGGVATSWTSYTRTTAPATVTYSIKDVSPPGGAGSYYQQVATSSEDGGAGIRQDVSGCTNGVTYTVQGWYRTNSSYTAHATVKVSPTASSDWATAINLDPAQTTQSTSWVTFDGDVDATGTQMTVWLDGQTDGTGLFKAACFDLISVHSDSVPTISAHPSNDEINGGETATFSVTASGTGTLGYQWQKDSSDMSNSGHYSGVTTSTLTVSDADGDDEADYRCVITDDCGTSTSNSASLTVNTGVSLLNGSFEDYTGDLADNWTSYTRSPVPATVGYSIKDVSPPADSGTYYQQIATSSADGGAGIRQDITDCTNGTNYIISGWMRTNSASAECQVKVSPTASADWATANDLDPAQSTTSNSWVTFDGAIDATSTSMTLWLDGTTNGSGLYKAQCFDAVTVQACSAPSLSNGSFESYTDGLGDNWTSYTRTPTPATTTWTIQSASPPEGGGTYYQQIANSSSDGGGGVRQNVTNCIKSATYTVAGWMRTNSASATCAVKASPTASTSWGDADDLDPAQTTTSNSWVAFDGDVQATDTSMTIWLDGTTNGSGLFKAQCFDLVSVTCAD